ncbi:MAG: glycoside hydrolase family 88 protein [Bacteroidetes bacterium]|nr:glycoside hydrolase family 88 protein [Bacteroidota bacterium]
MNLPNLRHLSLLLVLSGIGGCGSSGDTSRRADPLREVATIALDRAVTQYKLMDDAVPDSLLPRTSAEDGTLVTHRPGWWTSGFFPGSLWLLYEYAGDTDLKERAEARTWLIEGEKDNLGDHDIGFKINNSFGNALRITGDTTRYAPVVVDAAQSLLRRFDPTVGLIRSWGELDDTDEPYLVIIDNMMNLALLFRATELSGDSTFFNVAVTHADNTLRDHFRPDGSSYHVVEYSPRTGERMRGRTNQGAADSSAWARGQAWGLYGFTETYRNTDDRRYLDQAITIADFLLDNPALPDDGVPYWDFDAPGIPDALRDASAGAIMASALLELQDYVDANRASRYRSSAEKILRTLSGPEYLAEVGTNGNFLLKHSVGSVPANSEVDVPLTYADYYFIEALLRLDSVSDE